MMYNPVVFANPTMSMADVQRWVQWPDLYSLAMATDSIENKSMYIAEHLVDIETLQVPISNEDWPAILCHPASLQRW